MLESEFPLSLLMRNLKGQLPTENRYEIWLQPMKFHCGTVEARQCLLLYFNNLLSLYSILYH